MDNRRDDCSKLSSLSRIDKVISKGFLVQGSKVLEVIAGIGLFMLALVSFVTVFSRALGISGPWLTGSIDLSQLIMAIVAVLAGAVCWYAGGHLRIDILISRASPKIVNILNVVSACLFLGWMIITIWGGWEKVTESLVFGTKTWTGDIIIFPFMLLFFFALTHFSFVLLRSIWGLIAKMRGRPVEHDGLY